MYYCARFCFFIRCVRAAMHICIKLIEFCSQQKVVKKTAKQMFSVKMFANLAMRCVCKIFAIFRFTSDNTNLLMLK